MRHLVLTTVALAALAFAPAATAMEAPLLTPVQAQTPAPVTPPRVNVSLVGEAPPAAEQADAALYDAAMVDFNARGFAAMEPHLAGLREALSHAPAAYPVMTEVEGGWLIRTDSRDEALILARTIGEIQQSRGGGDVKVVVRPNTYPRIAFLLGSEAIERRDIAEANRFLDIGLAMQPLDRLLLNEKLVALHAERQWDAAYLLVKTALTAGDPLLEADPAHLQRRLGYTLIELGRLHEARAAYEASLVADPGNELALRELQFIANAEAGRPNDGEMEITAPLAPRPETAGSPTP